MKNDEVSSYLSGAAAGLALGGLAGAPLWLIWIAVAVLLVAALMRSTPPAKR